ncbi:signal transduction histidine kinase [Aequitasia blattaphilus]|uniref:histidine kinase n=1 Tax=Aequitasia blattaphilus TaxID=2949332 RepID=A0ABT1EC57_9FIRM|nr:HAMP domain-containing sensor histidine kinase [Aequitasia blattaphilus]MCP1103426.1 HAMP domain-containing histidine kinase [Aequitasia blattaphilus]MCR8616066.1 HAMP domain-containing histidine kinase [Aequitasia blattaphilus]
MKSGITKRLLLYFTATLLVFAVIIGLLFSSLFTKNMMQHNKNDLTNRANTIASTLSEFLDANLPSEHKGKSSSHGNGQNGFGAFLKLADDMAMGEVWLVDKDVNLITNSDHNPDISYEEFPQDGEVLIQNALIGEIGYSESFSELVGVKSITVCVPAYGLDGKILAAVLLHAPVESMEESITSGLWILMLSVGIALLLSSLMAMLLSKRFIRPIKAINITAQKLAAGDYSQKTSVRQNDEIGQLAETVDELSLRLLMSKNQSEQLEKEKRDFYTDISHELRTPVTVIRGSLESLQDGKIQDSKKQQEYYSHMLAETSYIQNMVNDLLDYSKLKNPEFTIQTELLNLSDILSDAVRSMRRVSEKKKIHLEYNNPFSLIEIQGNYEKLRQMFLIVLDNAIKFSPESETVSISIQKNTSQYSIKIHDNGFGISEEDIPHIFDRFYKNKTKKNEGGTGIGLTIAKQIAVLHNIRIFAESENGKGTDFYIDVDEIETFSIEPF